MNENSEKIVGLIELKEQAGALLEELQANELMSVDLRKRVQLLQGAVHTFLAKNKRKDDMQLLNAGCACGVDRSTKKLVDGVYVYADQKYRNYFINKLNFIKSLDDGSAGGHI